MLYFNYISKKQKQTNSKGRLHQVAVFVEGLPGSPHQPSLLRPYLLLLLGYTQSGPGDGSGEVLSKSLQSSPCSAAIVSSRDLALVLRGLMILVRTNIFQGQDTRKETAEGLALGPQLFNSRGLQTALCGAGKASPRDALGPAPMNRNGEGAADRQPHCLPGRKIPEHQRLGSEALVSVHQQLIR